LNQFGFDNKHSINTYQEKTMKLVSLLTNMNKITLVAITGLILSTCLVACSSNPAAPDAMKKDGDAMKKDDDAMKNDGDAMKKDGGAMKKDGDAMKQSPSPTSKP
jgi:outer membrane murein-binding lipoprotein Lpp